MIIYKVENKINGKVYIGQSKNDINQRIAKHIRRNKYYFQKALNKYGLESFTISVIDEAGTQEVLNEKEKYWIKFYNCKTPHGYNLTDGGESSNGYKHTEESRRRMSIASKGRRPTEETKRKMSIASAGRPSVMKGKYLSEETKQNMRHPRSPEAIENSRQGHMGLHRSEESKQKTSESLKGHIVTDITRQKLRETNIGKHHSEESKQKMRIPMAEEHKQKIRIANIGKHGKKQEIKNAPTK